MVSLLLIAVLSYLAGSIPGSLWVGRWIYGVDLRQHGSGNPGATNAFRVLGWKAGLIATVVDMGKGVLAAGLVAGLRIGALPAGLEGDQGALFVRLGAGVLAVAGHMYPVLAGFKGGKGVNTAGGVLLAVTPINFAIVIAVFALVLWRSHYVSLASMCAAVSYPASLAVMRFVLGWDVSTVLLVFGAVLALGIVVAHASNIRRLAAGTENRIRWVGAPTVTGDANKG